jgi:exosortase sorting signal-containing protein
VNKIFRGIAVACALLAGSQLAQAQVLVFDRGLPTANLNNAAGANKSNVAWADQETLPETPWRPGDDFTLAGVTPYTITTIRVWSLSSVGLVLRGGRAGSPIGVLSNSYTATPVTYSNLETYQSTAGPFLPLFQIDFAVNIPLNGGVPFQYFLDGPPNPVLPAGDNVSPTLHASNAPLSGSPQQGADGIMLFLDNTNTVLTWNALTGAGTYCPGCVGSDKVSDGNVQVFAVPFALGASGIPTMSEYGLIVLALMLGGGGFIALRRRGV